VIYLLRTKEYHQSTHTSFKYIFNKSPVCLD